MPKISVLISAIDKATEPLRRVQQQLDSIKKYDWVCDSFDITKRRFADSKIFITSDFSFYDSQAQIKDKDGNYIRRGLPGDPIVTVNGVYSHVDP